VTSTQAAERRLDEQLDTCARGLEPLDGGTRRLLLDRLAARRRAARLALVPAGPGLLVILSAAVVPFVEPRTEDVRQALTTPATAWMVVIPAVTALPDWTGTGLGISFMVVIVLNLAPKVISS